jgi:NADH-quinone oxidoreductase subunit L
MFHLVTHAFFKALLFLGAGIVIHALAGEQSLDRMGGLRRHLRTAYLCMAVGCLAIAGVPGFSGFFSKDDILAHALDAGALGVSLFVLGIAAAGLTAFYMFRLLFRTFHGPEPDGGYAHRPHPSGPAMTLPVVVLAVLAAVGGWMQVPGGWTAVTDWLAPVTGPALLEPSHAQEWITGVASTAVALIGIGVAWYLFAAGPRRRLSLAGVLTGPRSVLVDAYRFDAVYDAAVVDPTRALGDTLCDSVEPAGPLAIPEAVAETVRGAAVGAGAATTGLVRAYVISMVAGLAVVGAIILLAVKV